MAHDIDCVLGLETISTSWPDHGMFKQASIFQIRYPYFNQIWPVEASFHPPSPSSAWTWPRQKNSSDWVYSVCTLCSVILGLGKRID